MPCRVHSLTQWGGTALTDRDTSLDLANLNITLSAFRDAIVNATTPKDLLDIFNQLAATLSRNTAQWGGTSLTGRDVSTDLAKLDLALSALRDAVCAVAPNNKTLNDLYARLSETLVRDISDEAGRVLGQITDGTSAIAPANFGSGTHPRSITNWAGVALTGRDISLDLAKVDLALTALRDAICAAGVDAKTLNDLYGYLARYGQLPSDLTAAGNLKLSIQESAITVPFDLQAQLRALHASTTTALAANASWTSTSEEVLNFGRITGTVFADVAGTIYVEQSPDNTNWDVVDSWSVAANAGLGFSVELVARYVRIRYVNGATLQGTFRCVAWKRVQS